MTYLVPMSYRGVPLDAAVDALIGTAEHGVLGRRWIYDGVHDPVVVSRLLALAQGEAEAQHQDQDHSNTPDPSVTGRPGSAARLTHLSSRVLSRGGGGRTCIAVRAAGQAGDQAGDFEGPVSDVVIELVRILSEDAALSWSDGSPTSYGRVEVERPRADGSLARNCIALVR